MRLVGAVCKGPEMWPEHHVDLNQTHWRGYGIWTLVAAARVGRVPLDAMELVPNISRAKEYNTYVQSLADGLGDLVPFDFILSHERYQVVDFR